MATRTSQHINDHLLMACFGCVWVTRKWLCIFGNTASRDSLTCHSSLTVLDMGMRSTWACYRAAWTSASGGIFLLQITSIPTRAKKVSTPMCRRAPQTNRIGNGRDFLDVQRPTELLQSFHIGFLDVHTHAAIITKIAACYMYMCLLAVLEDSLRLTRKSNLQENPKQNRFTTMLVQSQS